MDDGQRVCVPNQSLGRWTLRRVRLNAGGYDRWGEYFGCGDPLFVYDGELSGWGTDYQGAPVVHIIHGHVRAADRPKAIAEVLARYPMATF